MRESKSSKTITNTKSIRKVRQKQQQTTPRNYSIVYSLICFIITTTNTITESFLLHKNLNSRNKRLQVINDGDNNDSIGVGIDLGTTNSAIAYLDDNDEPCIIEIPNNGRTIKSVVVTEGNSDDDNVDFSKALVGNDAIEWERQHKETTAYRHVKRVIGTCATYLSGDTKQVVPHLVPSADDDGGDDEEYDYNNKNKSKRRKGRSKRKKNKPPTLEKLIQAAKDDPTMLYPLTKEKSLSNLISPETVSSCILHNLLNVAAKHTGKTISRAVIGVPAYFNDAQRDATMRAANACGIEQVKLLREPEAAALAYGVDKDSTEEEELVLVFDLGGGTYDVSILLVEKGLTEIVCTAGDSQLGGTNFDAKIAKHLSQVVNGCCKSEEANDMLLRSAESIRIYLSNNRAAELALPETEAGWLGLQNPSHVILPKDYGTVDFEDGRNGTHIFYELSRKDMERLCVEEFQKLLRPIREVAVMAGALLPGDASPTMVESAIEMGSAFTDAENFYNDDDGQSTIAALEDLKSAKKMQQKGRKKAREVAKQEKKYRAESRKVQETQPDAKVRTGGISGRPISRVVLVGGATRMPTIGRIISSLTGIVPQRTVDPDEAVALGCAVHVGILDGKEEAGVVLTPMQAALLRAVVEKQRQEGQLDEIFFDEDDDDEFTEVEYF
jgi:molecular chaperone DnaK (HSP70)